MRDVLDDLKDLESTMGYLGQVESTARRAIAEIHRLRGEVSKWQGLAAGFELSAQLAQRRADRATQPVATEEQPTFWDIPKPSVPAVAVTDSVIDDALDAWFDGDCSRPHYPEHIDSMRAALQAAITSSAGNGNG